MKYIKTFIASSAATMSALLSSCGMLPLWMILKASQLFIVQ